MSQHNARDNSRLVYSTGAGRICAGCGKPSAQCTCRKKSATLAGNGNVRVMRESRNGKSVTVIRGVALDADALNVLGKQLRTACGAGGTVKDGAIEVQGDHADKVIELLKARNISAKRAGG